MQGFVQRGVASVSKLLSGSFNLSAHLSLPHVGLKNSLSLPSVWVEAALGNAAFSFNTAVDWKALNFSVTTNLDKIIPNFRSMSYAQLIEMITTVS